MCLRYLQQILALRILCLAQIREREMTARGDADETSRHWSAAPRGHHLIPADDVVGETAQVQRRFERRGGCRRLRCGQWDHDANAGFRRGGCGRTATSRMSDHPESR